MRIGHAAICAAAGIMTGGVGHAADDRLHGLWGGPGTVLTIGPDGALMEQDCAQAQFGPVKLDAKGHFRTTGAWEDHAPGPQAADRPLPRTSAAFEGQLRDDTLVLTIRRANGAPQSITLLRGKRAKLIRCL